MSLVSKSKDIDTDINATTTIQLTCRRQQENMCRGVQYREVGQRENDEKLGVKINDSTQCVAAICCVAGDVAIVERDQAKALCISRCSLSFPQYYGSHVTNN